MGRRLRVGAAASFVIIIAGSALPALAQTFTACWVTTERNSVTLTVEQVTRCRIAGGDVVDYADNASVPSRLYPNIGFDLLGECWYVTSAETSYEIVPLNPDGGAELVLIVDGSPGPSGYFRRCTSEPGVAVDPSAEAWAYVTT